MLNSNKKIKKRRLEKTKSEERGDSSSHPPYVAHSPYDFIFYRMIRSLRRKRSKLSSSAGSKRGKSGRYDNINRDDDDGMDKQHKKKASSPNSNFKRGRRRKNVRVQEGVIQQGWKSVGKDYERGVHHPATQYGNFPKGLGFGNFLEDKGIKPEFDEEWEELHKNPDMPEWNGCKRGDVVEISKKQFVVAEGHRTSVHKSKV